MSWPKTYEFVGREFSYQRLAITFLKLNSIKHPTISSDRPND